MQHNALECGKHEIKKSNGINSFLTISTIYIEKIISM